ncbi:hypothetical protein MMC25_001283 [Agyrium rufum]|nr:hypothetical protein [Agyrium rufum]
MPKLQKKTSLFFGAPLSPPASPNHTSMPSLHPTMLKRWSSRLRSNSKPLTPTSPIFDLSRQDSFGLPDLNNPDPFGVRALEQAGYKIREAGSRRPTSIDAFDYRPSPSSPIFPLANRQSTDNKFSLSHRRTNSTVSTSSFDRATQTADLPPPIVELPREEQKAERKSQQWQQRWQKPISYHQRLQRQTTLERQEQQEAEQQQQEVTYVEQSPSSNLSPSLSSSPRLSAMHTDVEDNDHSNDSDNFSNYDDAATDDSATDVSSTFEDYQDSAVIEDLTQAVHILPQPIASPNTMGPASRPRLVTIIKAVRRSSSSSSSPTSSPTSPEKFRPSLPRRSSRRVHNHEAPVTTTPPELVSDSASVATSDHWSPESRRDSSARDAFYGGFVGDAGNPWDEDGNRSSGFWKEVDGDVVSCLSAQDSKRNSDVFHSVVQTPVQERAGWF